MKLISSLKEWWRKRQEYKNFSLEDKIFFHVMAYNKSAFKIKLLLPRGKILLAECKEKGLSLGEECFLNAVANIMQQELTNLDKHVQAVSKLLNTTAQQASDFINKCLQVGEASTTVGDHDPAEHRDVSAEGKVCSSESDSSQ